MNVDSVCLLEALKGLLADVEEYQSINNLDGKNNHSQVVASAAIAAAEQNGDGTGISPDWMDSLVGWQRCLIVPNRWEANIAYGTWLTYSGTSEVAIYGDVRLVLPVRAYTRGDLRKIADTLGKPLIEGAKK